MQNPPIPILILGTTASQLDSSYAAILTKVDTPPRVHLFRRQRAAVGVEIGSHIPVDSKTGMCILGSATLRCRLVQRDVRAEVRVR
jgi:hypothetical protein